jgi:hypothetical protein
VKINEPTPEILEMHERWQVCRDVISGTYAVKKKGLTYLPRSFSDMNDEEYLSYKKYVPFYPAANRTHDGIVGLMMRQEPVLEATGTLREIKDVISSNGDSVEELARRSAREFLSSGFYGYFTDHPVGQASSKGAAIEEGIRPFVNFYDCFSILECTPGVVKGRKQPIRVRLLENARTVYLIERVDGLVVVHVYRASDNGAFPAWEDPTETYEPVANGKRLEEIPFDLVTPDGSFTPSAPPLENVCWTNLDHYVTQGLLSTQHLFGISPMLIVSGTEGEEGKKIKWTPGGVFTLSDAQAKAYVISVSADAAVPLEHQLQALEDRLAAIASRILARQKSVAEAAETEAVRQGAENSVLAMLANTISKKLETALKRAAAFTDNDATVRFQINTDYLPSNMSPQEITALLGLNQARKLSNRSMFYKLRDGGVYDETLTYEEEQKRLKEEAAVEPEVVNASAARDTIAPTAPEAPTL